MWDGGKFPEKPIREYLESQHEKFWLFHPERPFYQTKAAETRKGTPFTASKLHGALSQSNNKKRPRLFPVCLPDEKSGITDSITLTYSEAARWLIYLNDYSDTAVKPSGEAKKSAVKLPSMSVGWLGKLGIIYAIGDSLFKTLMLNFIVVNPLNMSLWEDEKPTWELDKPREKERCEIASPDNLAELYTLQSRRTFLERNDTGVTGYYLMGGDFFDENNASIEQMTLWERKDSKLSAPVFGPKRHDYNIKIWREFSTIFALLEKIQEEKNQEEKRLPGIVWWVRTLRNNKIIDRKRCINFGIASVEYEQTQKSCVEDIFWDSISFHTDLLMDVGKRWQKNISKEVGKCENIALALDELADNIEIASGYSSENSKKSTAVSNVQEQYYYEIDVPFREWLLSIDPEWESGSHEEHECIHKWHETSRNIARKLGKELVNSAEASAIVGRFKDKENGGKKREYISAARAFTDFMCVVNLKYPKEEQNG